MSGTVWPRREGLTEIPLPAAQDFQHPGDERAEVKVRPINGYIQHPDETDEDICDLHEVMSIFLSVSINLTYDSEVVELRGTTLVSKRRSTEGLLYALVCDYCIICWVEAEGNEREDEAETSPSGGPVNKLSVISTTGQSHTRAPKHQHIGSSLSQIYTTRRKLGRENHLKHTW